MRRQPWPTSHAATKPRLMYQNPLHSPPAPCAQGRVPGTLWVWRRGRGVRVGGSALLFAFIFVLIRAPTASAHTGAPLAPHDLPAAWNLSPLLLGGLLAIGWFYGCGVANCWRQTGRGRVVPVWRVGAFAAGLATLVIALISPLDALAGALFSAHMAQHLLLVVVAAPLLVAGAPPLPLLWALPPAWRREVGRWSHAPFLRAAGRVLTDPLVVAILHIATLWLWHLPRFYEAALRNEAIHVLEHITLLGTALLFWWVLMQPVGRRRTNHGAGIAVLFVASLQGIALGALIALADTAWYATYAASAEAWGLSSLDDQHLAGSLMLMPGGLVYLLAALALLIRTLDEAQSRANRVAARAAPALRSAVFASEPEAP
jgi:putative membrane protein